MTDLHKTVRRRTVGAPARGRRIMVALHPGDVLGFREERARTEYLLSVAGAYTYAVRLEVARRRAEKAAARRKP